MYFMVWLYERHQLILLLLNSLIMIKTTGVKSYRN
jgi:hypothetical protein